MEFEDSSSDLNSQECDLESLQSSITSNRTVDSETTNNRFKGKELQLINVDQTTSTVDSSNCSSNTSNYKNNIIN